MVLLISFSAMQRDNKKQSLPGQSEVNGIIATIDNVIKAPIVGVENMAKSINNLFNTYSENDNLKKKVDKVEALKNDITNLKDENEKLKQQLELNENLLNYDVINASVINRSPDSWQDTLIIDKGTADGIEVLLGRKKDSHYYCLVGGFADIKDKIEEKKEEEKEKAEEKNKSENSEN